MKIHATVQHTAQIGPYEYEMQTKVMDLEPETTVAEIIAWEKKVCRRAENCPTPVHLQISAEEDNPGG